MSNETLLACFLGINFVNMGFYYHALARLNFAVIDIHKKLDNFL